MSICVYTIQIKVDCRIKTKIFYRARFNTPLGLWHIRSAWGHCTRPKRPTIKIISNSTSVIRNGKLSTFHFTRESRVTAIEGTGFESRHPFPFTCSVREGGTEKASKGPAERPDKAGKWHGTLYKQCSVEVDTRSKIQGCQFFPGYAGFPASNL